MKRSGIGTACLVSLAVGIAAATPAGAADSDPGFLKMALVNMRCLGSHGSDASANQAAIRKNLDRHLYFVDRAAAEGAEFVGFPELSLNGYWYSQTMIWLKLDGPEVRTLAKKAIEEGVYITAGMAEQDAAGKRWNTHSVIGPDGKIVGWCNQLRVYAALHNHAAYYNPAFDPPPGPHTPLKGWASGAWFIGPDGATLNQMPTSTQGSDSREWVLMFNVPTAKNAPPAAPDPAFAQPVHSASTSAAAAAASTSFTAPGGATDVKAAACLDQYGDALPEGAVRRFGSIRFTQPEGCGVVALSPDGTIAATGSLDRVRLLEMPSGRKLRDIPHGSYAISFSPDGKRLAFADESRMVRLWDLHKGTELFAAKHAAPPREYRKVTGLKFFPDGSSFASAGGEGDVRIWDTTTGRELLVLHHGEKSHDTLRLAISPNGTYLASSNGDTIRVWNLEAGGDPVVIRKAHLREVTALEFAPDSRTLISGGRGYEKVQDRGQEFLQSCAQIRTWECVTGKARPALLADERGQRVVGLVAVERRLFATLRDRLDVYDLDSGKRQRSIPLARSQQNFSSHALAVSRDGLVCLLACNMSPRLGVLDLRRNDSIERPPEGHLSDVRGTTFTPDGETVISGSSDGTVRFWDIATGRQTRQLVFSDDCMNLAEIALTGDGKLLAASGNTSEEQGIVRVWDAGTGSVLRDFTVPECGSSLAFSPDGKRLAVASHFLARLGAQMPISVFDVTTGKTVAEFPAQGWGYGSVHFLHQNRLAAVRDKLRVWDLSRGTTERELDVGRPQDTQSRFSRDGTRLAVDGWKVVTIWNVEAGKVGAIVALPRRSSGYPFDFSPDGKLLVSSGGWDRFHLWDAATGKELLQHLTPDSAPRSFAFSPDGRQVATGMNDGTILLWDISQASRR